MIFVQLLIIEIIVRSPTISLQRLFIFLCFASHSHPLNNFFFINFLNIFLDNNHLTILQFETILENFIERMK